MSNFNIMTPKEVEDMLAQVEKEIDEYKISLQFEIREVALKNELIKIKTQLVAYMTVYAKARRELLNERAKNALFNPVMTTTEQVN